MNPPNRTMGPPAARPAALEHSKRCETCEYFRPLVATNPLNVKEKPPGLCLRYPPVPMVLVPGFVKQMMQGPQMASPPVIQPLFPQVQSEDFCGEYNPKL